jgi:signal transduction histidine kinase
MPRGRGGGQNERVTVTGMRTAVRDAVREALRPAGPPPPLTRLGWATDVLLALALGVASVVYALEQAAGQTRFRPFEGVLVVPPAGPGKTALLVGVAALASGLLVLRRRFPLAVLWGVMGAVLLTPDHAPRATFYALVIAVYSAAAHSPHRLRVLVSLPVAVLLFVVRQEAVTAVVSDDTAPLIILVPLTVAAYGIGTWRSRVAAAERAAVGRERARIARELHDVVTHHVSVMVIQAGAARKVMAAAPDQAAGALLAVESGGRAALAELRQVMGLLTEEGEDGGLAPQPGLAQLPAMVERVRNSGLPVELTVEGEPRPVPDGVQLAVYRVVQEALTNTVKHAVGASATVTVTYGVREIRVRVTDTGGRPGPSASAGNGRGLLGLEERLAVHGGTLRGARRIGGGYRVEARIPLEEATAA